MTGMAYAKLAQLDPQFGLYSSFVGVMLYWCVTPAISVLL
jgi:MFS superfamily sulfate permease-like transporter